METIKQRTLTETPEVVLYSTWFCPYAQRAWIALEAKHLNYKWVNCTLYDGNPSTKHALSLEEKEQRTPGFIHASPRGLVPAIIHNNVSIYESLPVIEYIEESFHNLYSLLPTSPVERAKIRIGISLWQELIIRKFYSVLLSPLEEWEKEKSALLSGLVEIASLFTEEGSFFSSHGFSLFECACLPWYQRFHSVLKHYRNFEVPKTDKFARLHEWYAACLLNPAFSATLVDEDILIGNYIGYANNSADNNQSGLIRK